MAKTKIHHRQKFVINFFLSQHSKFALDKAKNTPELKFYLYFRKRSGLPSHSLKFCCVNRRAIFENIMNWEIHRKAPQFHIFYSRSFTFLARYKGMLVKAPSLRYPRLDKRMALVGWCSATQWLLQNLVLCHLPERHHTWTSRLA